jgi:8-oxo-dGTP diphosphatase
MELPKVGTAVFVYKDDEFLMLKRTGAHGAGTWSLPGGKLDFGEELEDSAHREVLEETGLEIKNIRQLAVTNDIFADEDKHFVTIWFTSDWGSGEASILEPEKCTEQGWFDFQHLPSPLFEPGYRNLRQIKPELWQ